MSAADGPKPKNRPYLGLCGSKCDSEGTLPISNPQLFAGSTPQNCPNGHLDACIATHLACASSKLEPQTGRAKNGFSGPPALLSI